MSQWEQDKQIYLSLLKTGNGTIDDILKLDDESHIMSTEERALIKECYEKNSVSIQKLEKDLFEVAVVGLEKAGKSTFANALISNKILPDASIRCTYTATQLEFGDEDKAVVEFYSFNEFNEKFINLLKSVEYDTSGLKGFESLELADFEQYFNELKFTNPALHQMHAARTEEDIKEIISGKEEIKQYLELAPREFRDYEVYGEELKSFITNPRKSRAAKKIIIRSRELKDMKNIVIYDVPGFDSPTQIHEKQTIERLKHADSIVLVTNVGQTPNLLGTQLNVLLKENDDDGIRLCDKFFIFGNKIDLANDRFSAERNIDALKTDSIEKYKLVDHKRLFVGSSMAYLQELQLEQGGYAVEKLESFGLTHNIPEFKQALQEYYSKERFDVLKKRIDNNIKTMKSIFHGIYEKNNQESNLEGIESSKYLITTRFMSQAIQNLENNLSQLRDDVKQDILDNEYFTKKIKQLLDCSFEKITDEDIEQVRILVSQAPGSEFPTDKVNNKLREMLYSKFMSKFTGIVIEVANEKVTETNNQILETLLKSFEIYKGNPFYREVVQSVSALIEKTTSEVSYDRKSFVHLIERFSRDLFDILIFYPFATPSRFEKFEKAEQDFYSLAMYYSKRKVNKPFYMQPLIDIILAHEQMGKVSIAEIENKMFNLIHGIPVLTRLSSSLRETIKSYAKQIREEAIDVDTFMDLLEEGFHKIERVLNGTTNEAVALDISTKVFKSVYDELMNSSRYPTRENHLEVLRNKLKPSYTREELLNEINTDIDYLNLLLRDVVTRAISLEKPFLSTLTKQINKLIELKNSEAVSDFIARNVAKIKANELAEIERRIKEIKNRRLVVDKIQILVDKIEHASNSVQKELVLV